MRRVTLQPGEVLSNEQMQRFSAFDADAMRSATDIVEAVREGGDKALREYTAKFDGVELEDFRVSQAAIDAALATLDPKLAESLQHAVNQVREFHERQKQESMFAVRDNGALVGSKQTPIQSVGIYVPGGRALYPSSVIMNAVPAQVAGVERIVCVTPPTKDGSLDAAVLEACRLCGVTEIYSIGGAQAVAALAYGTESIKPVNKITGPGNAYVAAAKKIVMGDVGIDMIAGPSEVLVVADETAEARMVAIDIMAQAEHDPLATCYLVCFSDDYADRVEANIAEHMKRSKRAEITAASLEHGLIVVCPDMPTAIGAVNEVAPEHLELHIEDGMGQLRAIKNAGAIFVGEWTPEAVGDYVAGPNHTLPTGGTAKFSSPLGTMDFMKHSSVIQYTRLSLAADGASIVAIADREGLWAHAESVRLRLAELAE